MCVNRPRTQVGVPLAAMYGSKLGHVGAVLFFVKICGNNYFSGPCKGFHLFDCCGDTRSSEMGQMRRQVGFPGPVSIKSYGGESQFPVDINMSPFVEKRDGHKLLPACFCDVLPRVFWRLATRSRPRCSLSMICGLN